jgi:predicted peroxiredoxin
MASYLLIESRDPFETRDVAYFYGLAADLVRARNTVTLFLIQNGVLPARAAANFAGLDAVVKAGVEVLADEFSLRERGIRADALRDGVKAAPLDVVVDQLADGRKAMWH